MPLLDRRGEVSTARAGLVFLRAATPSHYSEYKKTDGNQWVVVGVDTMIIDALVVGGVVVGCCCRRCCSWLV